MQPVMILAIGMRNLLIMGPIKTVAEKDAEKKFEKTLNEIWPDMEMKFEPNEFDK